MSDVEIDLTEIDSAVAAEDWTAVLAIMFAGRDDPERHVEICAHALKGALCTRRARWPGYGTSEIYEYARHGAVRNIAMDIVDALGSYRRP